MRSNLLFLTILSIFLLMCNGDNSFPPTSDASIDNNLPDVITQYDVIVPPISDAGLVDGQFDLGYPMSSPLHYKGGSVMTEPANVYFIWYGNWANKQTVPILEDLIRNIGSSDWFKINTAYYQQALIQMPETGNALKSISRTKYVNDILHVNNDTVFSNDSSSNIRVYVDGRVHFMSSIYVGYTYGVLLHDEDINSIVADALSSGVLPYDINGIYYVLSSDDVNQIASPYTFCGDYCGWHTNTTILNSNMRIVFVGDVMRCPDACSLKNEYEKIGVLNSPNGDWSADGMASIMLHELAETITDPDASTNAAWKNDYGQENGDLCAWIYGLPYYTNNNSIANVSIGNRHFMIQENWVLDSPDTGHCGLQL